jgi:putative tricarboxylic transport membrane protein
MGTYDRVSTIFLLGFALFICVESYRLGPGTFSQPGPGFLPLGSGLVIGAFALLLLAGVGRKKNASPDLPAGRIAWKKVGTILASLAAYAALLNLLGFHLINLLWLGIICRGMGRMGWPAALAVSLGSTFGAYLLFEYYLSIRFPRGVLGI